MIQRERRRSAAHPPRRSGSGARSRSRARRPSRASPSPSLPSTRRLRRNSSSGSTTRAPSPFVAAPRRARRQPAWRPRCARSGSRIQVPWRSARPDGRRRPLGEGIAQAGVAPSLRARRLAAATPAELAHVLSASVDEAEATADPPFAASLAAKARRLTAARIARLRLAGHAVIVGVESGASGSPLVTGTSAIWLVQAV